MNKIIKILLLVFLSYGFANSQTIAVELRNLGEVVEGSQRISVNFTSTDDLTDKWGAQTLTIGWAQSTGMESSVPNPSSSISNFTSDPLLPYSQSFNGFAYTLAEISGGAAADDGNVYTTFGIPGSSELGFTLSAGVSTEVFYFDYVLPVSAMKNKNTSLRFAPNEIFILENQPDGVGNNIAASIIHEAVSNSSIFSGSTATQLPVELTSFKAQNQETYSLLSWETSSEINNDFFNIERSADGKSFSKIGKVKGNGTTTETQNYEFLDREPVAGLNYYRLKQVDFNGEYEYSKVETVDFRTGDEGDINIFPNPSVDYVNIELDRAYEGVKVINQLGQIVENIPATSFENNNIKLNVADYTPGVYYIEAKLNHEVVNKQFVKIK